jgi:hypothetical protein
MSKRKKEEKGRFTARRKVEAVMRLLKGEDLDTVSRAGRHSSHAIGMAGCLSCERGSRAEEPRAERS